MIKCKITNKDKEEFRENGFIIKEKFIDSEYIPELLSKFEPLFKGDFSTGIEPDEWNWVYGKDDNHATRQICNAWKSDNLIRDLVCHEVIGKNLAILMGWEGSRILQDNILWKPPGGKTLGYHQDASYDDWIIPQTMATCWMTLDSTSRETGTLEYIVNSHNWELSPPNFEFHSPENYKQSLNEFAKRKNKEIIIKYVEIPAGGVAFHHGLTWHGSGINKSKNHRRAIVSHCIPSNATFHPTNTGGTGKIYKKYKKINSLELDESFFPILWSENEKSTFSDKS